MTFGQLYEQHADRIYRYHLVRTGDPALAEDLTAETFHAALEGFARYRPGKGSHAAWLAGIARHKLADSYRRRRTLPLDLVDERAAPAASAAPTEETVQRRLQMAAVAAAMKHISPDRAEALALHFFAGLTLEDAGAAMGRNSEAVKKLVQRGLADLRRSLAAVEEVA